MKKRVFIFSLCFIAYMFKLQAQEEYCDTLKWKVTETYYCEQDGNGFKKIGNLNNAIINIDTLSVFFPGIETVNISNDTFYENTGFTVLAEIYIYSDTGLVYFLAGVKGYLFDTDVFPNDTDAFGVGIKIDLKNDIVDPLEQEGITIDKISYCQMIISMLSTDKDGTYSERVFYAGADTSTFYITKTPVSIQEITHNQVDICIFPNPARSQFTVTNTENANIQLYNMQGQKIKQVIGKEENTVIQTSDLSAGMYVLKMEKKDAIQTKKIQIVH